MIQIKVDYQKQNLFKIVVAGHAMYDEFGKDIVCSAVSTCVITTINGIIEIDKDALQVEKINGKIIIEVKKQDTVIQKLLWNMIKTLEDLKSQYPKNISLNKEEIK